MEIFHQKSLILLNVVSIYNLCIIFADKCLKMKLFIYMYVCTVLCRIFLKNAQVNIYSLADLNIRHCVELTFFEGKLDGFFVLKVQTSSYKQKNPNNSHLSCIYFHFRFQNAISIKNYNLRNLTNLPSRKANSTQ